MGSMKKVILKFHTGGLPGMLFIAMMYPDLNLGIL
jgi:hypothetical protein